MLIRLIVECPGTITLATGTVVNNLVREQIAINAEVVSARCAFIATAYTHSLGVVLGRLPLILGRHYRERKPTGETGGAS